MSWLRENVLNEKKWVLVSSQQLKEKILAILSIIWLNKSKISRCHRDDKNFSLRVYHLIEGGRVNPQRGNSLPRWQRDDENFFLMVLAGRPTDSRDLKCWGRVNLQRYISLSHWQKLLFEGASRQTNWFKGLKMQGQVEPSKRYFFVSLATRRRKLLFEGRPSPSIL